MMALEIPLLRKAKRCQVVPVYMQTASPTRGGGQQVVSVGPDLWSFDYDFFLPRADADQLIAQLHSLRGGQRLMRAFDPLRRFARAGGYGAWDGMCTLAAVTPQLDGVTLSGVPPTLRLQSGDMISLAYTSGIQTLHRVIVGGAAVGGAIAVAVEPIVRPGWSGVATLTEPWCKSVFDPRSLTQTWTPFGEACEIGFKAMQVLA